MVIYFMRFFNPYAFTIYAPASFGQRYAFRHSLQPQAPPQPISKLGKDSLGSRLRNALGNIINVGVDNLAMVDNNGVAQRPVSLNPTDGLAEFQASVRHEQLDGRFPR